jgi:hypothetical protein
MPSSFIARVLTLPVQAEQDTYRHNTVGKCVPSQPMPHAPAEAFAQQDVSPLDGIPTSLALRLEPDFGAAMRVGKSQTHTPNSRAPIR